MFPCGSLQLGILPDAAHVCATLVKRGIHAGASRQDSGGFTKLCFVLPLSSLLCGVTNLCEVASSADLCFPCAPWLPVSKCLLYASVDSPRTHRGLTEVLQRTCPQRLCSTRVLMRFFLHDMHHTWVLRGLAIKPMPYTRVL